MKTTSTMTSGQILFISILVVCATVMSFYIGAKFGGDVFGIERRQGDILQLLPNDRLADDMKRYLADHAAELTYYQTLIENRDPVIPVSPVAGENVEPEPVAPKNAASERLPEVIPQNSESATQPKTDPATPVLSKTLTPDQTNQNRELPSTAMVSAGSAGVPTESKAKNTTPTDEPNTILTETQDAPVVTAPPATDHSARVYQLVVGSFSDSAKAHAALNQWRERGFAADVFTEQVKGKGTWYRIRLGSYTDQAVVNDVQRNVIHSYQTTPRIVVGTP